jgi:hypothetical protein
VFFWVFFLGGGGGIFFVAGVLALAGLAAYSVSADANPNQS